MTENAKKREECIGANLPAGFIERNGLIDPTIDEEDEDPVAPAPTASATHEKVLSIDAAQELVDEIKNLRAEVTRLTEWNNNQLETITIQRKIRAYVAFVLTGDELADVQMAADKTMEKLQALEAYASSQSEKGAAEIERLSKHLEARQREIANIEAINEAHLKRAEAAESKLSQLQLALGELLAHDGDSGSEDFDAAKLMAAREKLAILNGGQQ